MAVSAIDHPLLERIRNMQKILITLVLLVSLSACKTTEGYKQTLNSWVGQNVDLFVASWGPPNGSHTNADGSKVLQYVQSGSIYMPGTTITTPQTTYSSGSVYGNNGGYGTYSGSSTTYVTTTSPSYTIATNCRTKFFVSSSNRIQSWQAEGNNCVAEELKSTGSSSPSHRQGPSDGEQDRNKIRECIKDGETKMLNYWKCNDWGGQRIQLAW